MQNICALESTGDWFAAQVWSGREEISANHLRSRGYDIFLPRYRQYRRWSDRVKKVDRVLFPGYLFCRLHRDVLGKVLTAPGVIRIVGDSERPWSIPPEEIDAILRVVDTGLAAEPWPFPLAGKRVRIATGPLQDIEGVVLSTKGGHRLIISISLLRRSVAVEIEADCVSVIGDADRSTRERAAPIC